MATPEDGVLVEPDNPAALAGAMVELIDAPERRRALGRRSQALVRAQFSIETMATALLRHLEGLT